MSIVEILPIGGTEMAWIRLHRLLALLNQRGINFSDVTVFVDDHVINPRCRHPFPEERPSEDDEELYEDYSEED